MCNISNPLEAIFFVDGLVEGWMDEWMDGQTDGWIVI